MKIFVAIPCMDMMYSRTANSLLSLRPPEGATLCHGFAIGSLVYDARNRLMDAAVKDGFDYILWVDSDMVFEPDALQTLYADMQETGADIVAGLYVSRKPPIHPVIYSKCRMDKDDDGQDAIVVRKFLDYPQNAVFPVEAMGFGLCMMTTELCKKLLEEEGPPFIPIPGLGEDLSFCVRANDHGAKMFCDSRIKCRHIGTYEYGEDDFLVMGDV